MNAMTSHTHLVITSISGPNAVLSSHAEGSLKAGIDFIVIGDRKSPKDFSLAGCDYWSIARQRRSDFLLARSLPEGHYSRKNLGYLLAMERGAEIIIETDDDNFPLEGFWSQRVPWVRAFDLLDAGWVNVYPYFTDARIWPRGFPLECVTRPTPPIGSLVERDCHCPIQQGLANLNPDVDAVYRLIMPLPVSFGSHLKLALGKKTWSPFNSQNTTWFKAAFPLMYIPSFCSFRMCDIWRSFVALRICWANDWRLLFHGPTVWQERNEHNLLRDFQDEIPGYLNNTRMCDILTDLEIKGGAKHIAENLLVCYEALISGGFVGIGELAMLRDWLSDVGNLLT